MAFEGIAYPVDDYTRELDELDRIIMFDRFLVDINTGSTAVTPVLIMNGTEVTFTDLNNAARTVEEIAVDRFGPCQEAQLRYDLANDVKIYALDLVIRPLDLGINILVGGKSSSSGMAAGTRVEMRGRASDPTTSIFYDINPFSLPTDARAQNAIIQRLYIDAVTGAQTITPVLVFEDGTTTSLTGLTNASRAITEYSIGTTQRLKRLRLDADFTNSAIIVYDVEIDLYISKSQLR